VSKYELRTALAAGALALAGPARRRALGRARGRRSRAGSPFGRLRGRRLGGHRRARDRSCRVLLGEPAGRLTASSADRVPGRARVRHGGHLDLRPWCTSTSPGRRPANCSSSPSSRPRFGSGSRADLPCRRSSCRSFSAASGCGATASRHPDSASTTSPSRSAFTSCWERSSAGSSTASPTSPPSPRRGRPKPRRSGTSSGGGPISSTPPDAVRAHSAPRSTWRRPSELSSGSCAGSCLSTVPRSSWPTSRRRGWSRPQERVRRQSYGPALGAR
jgi:hypothetical protein